MNKTNTSFEPDKVKNILTIEKREDGLKTLGYKSFSDFFIYDSMAEKFIFDVGKAGELLTPNFEIEEIFCVYLRCEINQDLTVASASILCDPRSQFPGYIEGSENEKSFTQTHANYIIAILKKDTIISQNPFFHSYLSTQLAIINQSFGIILGAANDLAKIKYLTAEYE